MIDPRGLLVAWFVGFSLGFDTKPRFDYISRTLDR